MMDIIFWDFLILYQNFFSPQVQRRMIISNKHGIYELPHELPNDLRLRIFEIRENQENVKTSENYILVPSPQNKSFVNASKNLLKNRN